MEYKLNIKWIKELENEIHILKKNYDNEEEKKESMQERTNDFISVTAPKIRDYIGNDKVSLIAISGGGKLFAMALLKYFLKHGVDTTYNEYNRNESENKSIFKKEDVENRKVLLVDSEIYSGATFKIVMEKISRIKKKFSIKDVKFVVDRDTQGLADFSRTE